MDLIRTRLKYSYTMNNSAKIMVLSLSLSRRIWPKRTLVNYDIDSTLAPAVPGLRAAASSAAPLEDQPPARCGRLVFLTFPLSLMSQSFRPRHHTLYRQPVIIRILFINLHRPRLNNHRFPELYLLPQIMIDKPIQ